ncbi:AP2-like ethylene-responsive transcription factor At1g16060 [Solanum tuberosum]|uniref:AP2-like ethylene-responsive transcription factor At1g16060 n=1 Tax=Solanum tuberosum TaxID=4113 RepID=UPI00073A41EC|nr:PREDICTED: AP2-like ethylene-responsive transcription factor At1g16060 [Solanum tuberosum]
MMNAISVKCEKLSPGNRRSLCMVDYDIPVNNKCVKRRRKSPVAAVIVNDNNNNGQKLDSSKVDQSSSIVQTRTVKRSSRFRGVSRHRWTGRYEAHLWDKASWNVTQKKKGKQVYLGAYDEEESAARAYDLAAIKYWGTTTFTNFPISDYEKEIEIMQNMTKEEHLASLRRRSSGFARGVSKYRGVARHHHNNRWEARIGRVFDTQEEAARAYDIAAIEYRGTNAMTNFDMNTYIRWLKPDANSLMQFQDLTSEDQPIQTSNTNDMINPLHDSSYSFNHNHFTTTTNTEKLYAIPRSQEPIERKMPLSYCRKSSSPTALSLLLRSSMFQELVEKNSSTDSEESEENNMKHGAQSNRENDFLFYTNDKLPKLESLENGTTSSSALCDREGQQYFGIDES